MRISFTNHNDKNNSSTIQNPTPKYIYVRISFTNHNDNNNSSAIQNPPPKYIYVRISFTNNMTKLIQVQEPTTKIHICENKVY